MLEHQLTAEAFPAGGESGLHYNQGGNRGPVNVGHLHKPRDDDGRSRSDCCSNRVCDRRKVLFVPSPEFHGRNHLCCRFALARSQSMPALSLATCVSSQTQPFRITSAYSIPKEVGHITSRGAAKNPKLAQSRSMPLWPKLDHDQL